MTRAQIRARLTGDKGEPLVPLSWWAQADAALAEPGTRMVITWMARQRGKSQFLMIRSVEELLLMPNSFTLFVAASREQAEQIFHRKLRLPLQRPAPRRGPAAQHDQVHAGERQERGPQQRAGRRREQ